MEDLTPNLPDRARRARDHVASVKRAVDASLERHLQAAERRAAGAGRSAQVLVESIAALVRRGGKRLRPALTIAAYEACGGADDRRAALIDVGCAWELLQAYFLVHDDWMDGDVTRRGGPTVHVALTEHHRDAQLGAASAILAGDHACALAHRVLLECDAPAELVREAAAAFARVHEEVVLGQSIDLTLDAADAAAVERMHALKTGSYTVRGPLEIGAIFARAGGDARAALDRFARPIGVAFQLRDDLLGTFGDANETGKPVGNDLRARKRTALVVEALARAPHDDAGRLQAMMGAGAPSDDEVAWAMRLIDSSGARRAIEARLQALVAEANVALQDGALSRDGAALLGGLAAFVVDRSS